MIGSTISHYKILDKLGEGGMGEVFLAEDPRLERKVALKFLPPHMSRDREALKRFEREAKATAALNHPNIVTIHEIAEHEGRHYIAMAYIEGDLLSELIEAKTLTIEATLDIMLELCDALGEAHKAGIIHRDLKPANIIVDRRGRAHILDFGLAAKSGATRLTQEGTTVGSLHYMSPEQSSGSEVDERTDIFSLGAVLYEMIAGQPAFPGDHAAAIMYKIANEEPQPLARYNNKVTPELERIVVKAIAKDREVRYQTMSGLAAALKPLRAGATTADESKSAAQVLLAAAVAMGRFLIKPAVISGVVVGVAGFIVGSMITRGPDSSPAGQQGGDRSLARLMIPIPDNTWVVPCAEASSIAISPDGQSVVYVAAGPSDLVRRGVNSAARQTFLYLRAIDSNELVRIDGTKGAIGPFFSPDGKWIGYADFEAGYLRKVSMGGGAPVELCNVKTNFRGASWGDDDRIYISSDVYNGISVIPADGGEPTPVTLPDKDPMEKTRRFPHILPGSKALLFTRGDADILSYDDADVALYIMESEETRVLVPGGTNPRYVPTGHIVFGRGGRLLAVPFDVEKLEVTGSPFYVLEDVITSDGYGAAHYAFSQNGTLVYIPGGPDHYYSQLMTVDLDGKAELLPLPSRLYGNVRVSPDGERLVLGIHGANANLSVYETQRGTVTQLTHAWDNYSPSWHPDGKMITYSSNRGGTPTIWHMRLDGAGEPQPLSGEPRSAFAGAWSYDGKQLAYSIVSPTTGSDVWVWSVDDSISRPTIGDPGQQFFPAFSPDGRWISYVSDESGEPEVYVQPFPITGQKWILSQGGGNAPVWSRGGQELYFLSGHKIMVAPMRFEPEFTPLRARVLVDAKVTDIQGFDVFPDGQRFVVIGRLEGATNRPAIPRPDGNRRVYPTMNPELHVVVNWFEELQ